ncbi:hypothetical protein VSX60_10360 [Aurantimonas sp. A3-2-R12]|nr:hypothetical protein [Aurantimonas sp. A3-2-R12]
MSRKTTLRTGRPRSINRYLVCTGLANDFVSPHCQGSRLYRSSLFVTGSERSFPEGKTHQINDVRGYTPKEVEYPPHPAPLKERGHRLQAFILKACGAKFDATGGKMQSAFGVDAKLEHFQ